MQSNIEIKNLTIQDLDFLNQTEKLFFDLHEYLKPKKLQLPLIENGEKIWVQSIKNTLGKYSTVVVAIKESKVVGFGCGILKFLPEYLGSNKIGSITHFFICDEYRDMNIGKGINEKLYEWFSLQNITSIEVQVAAINPEAEIFWKKNGFAHELIQLRKFM